MWKKWRSGGLNWFGKSTFVTYVRNSYCFESIFCIFVTIDLLTNLHNAQLIRIINIDI